MTVTTARPSAAPGPSPSRHLEHRLARVLTAGMVAGIGLLAAGVVAMAAAGARPFGGGAPELEPSRLAGDLAALRPAGFLWLGLVAIIVTPSARVAGALVGFALEGDRRMAAIAAAVLAVIGLSVVAGWMGA